MKKLNCSSRYSGFTLIELLVVIAIISILASALFLMINPAQLLRKARETTLRSTTAKLCTALFACASVKKTASDCDDYTDLGITQVPSEPAGFDYIFPQDTDPVVITGTYTTGGNTCTYTCSFNFSDGATINLLDKGAGCL